MSEEELKKAVESHLSEWFRGMGIETHQIKNSAREIVKLASVYGNSRELEGRIDELDNKLPGAMGYRNITPIIASNISKRIDELESQKGSMNE